MYIAVTRLMTVAPLEANQSGLLKSPILTLATRLTSSPTIFVYGQSTTRITHRDLAFGLGPSCSLP
jgi:hypothetical protein